MLDCVEVWKQTDLLTIFPKIPTDLCAADTNTLKEFSVVQKHLPIKKSDNELGKEIIKHMYIGVAEGIKLQSEREYGFSKSDARAIRQTYTQWTIRITNKQVRYRKEIVKI